MSLLNDKDIMTSKTSENVFDEIMSQVGDSGKFQKHYNVIFNLVFVAVATMANFNPLISLSVPEHWCKVPGREATNFSVNEWKVINIPRVDNESEEFSQCSMFNRTDHNYTTNDNLLVECRYGWEFDQSYYTETIVSQENWVCKHQLHVTNLMVFGKIGEILGTSVSQLGDIYGRRPVIYISIVTLVIGRFGLLISSGFFWLYVAFLMLGNLSSLPVFQTPLVLSVEISSVEDRSFIPLMQCIGWTVGLCIAPLIFWIVGDWKLFTIVSTLPLVPFLFLRTYMVESPRWLASKGRTKKCVKELKRIAKVNKSIIADDVLVSLNKEAVQSEMNLGVMSLFSNWNLAKKSLLLIIGWTCYMLIYLTLFLNVSNLKGNPFMNYFWQGLAELPGYFLGKYLCDAIGRKYTKFLGFALMGVVSVALGYFISIPGHVIIISICGSVLKFISSIEFYAINLQTIEIYPTCLRQTGSSLGMLVASVFSIFAPYIIHLGTSVHPSIPYVVITVLCAIGAVFGMFLPETLNEKLPETLDESVRFGEDQKIWGLPRRTHTVVANDDI